MGDSNESFFNKALPYLVISVFVLGFFSLIGATKQARTCEDDLGFKQFTAVCESGILLKKLIYPPTCSVSYIKDGAKMVFSSDGPAKQIAKEVYEFSPSNFTTFSPDFHMIKRPLKFVVRVHFDKHIIDVKGDISGRFAYCHYGEY